MRTVLAAIAGLWLLGASPSAQEVYQPNRKDIVPPRILTQVKAEYTPAAREARIEGDVLMSAVVKADGTVGDVELVVSLDTMYGLDEAAVKALRQWTFRPGTKDGQPVAVQITVQLACKLR